MITIPYLVARHIALNVHPVAAWRDYFGISQDTLSKMLNMKKSEIEHIEKSNKHLLPEILERLCDIFSIVPSALEIRYHSTNQDFLERHKKNEKNFFTNK